MVFTSTVGVSTAPPIPLSEAGYSTRHNSCVLLSSYVSGRQDGRKNVIVREQITEIFQPPTRDMKPRRPFAWARHGRVLERLTTEDEGFTGKSSLIFSRPSIPPLSTIQIIPERILHSFLPVYLQSGLSGRQQRG